MSEKNRSQRRFLFPLAGAVLVAVGLYLYYFGFGWTGRPALDAGKVPQSAESPQGASSHINPGGPAQVASGNPSTVASVPSRDVQVSGAGNSPKPMSSAAGAAGGNSAPIFQMRANNATPTPAASREPYKIREETRDIEGPSLLEMARQFQTGAASEMAFPLFDGEQVLLTDVKLSLIDGRSGVFLAKVRGEPGGGHVALSYVNDIIDGEIHIPSQNRYFTLRTTGGDAPRNVLAQLDNEKMPRCGSCPPAP